jgi:hypothetical protein
MSDADLIGKRLNKRIYVLEATYTQKKKSKDGKEDKREITVQERCFGSVTEARRRHAAMVSRLENVTSSDLSYVTRN